MTVALFAEDPTDYLAIEQLIVALCPSAAGRVVKRRRPLLLAKGAQAAALQKRAAQLAATVRQIEISDGPVTCVFVHEDADAVTPADARRSAEMRAAAHAADVEICPVVPAWELEAWWFLFPDAVAAAFPSWKKLTPRATVDRITDAKEKFRDATTDRRTRRRYREADGQAIAGKVRALGLARAPMGTCASYTRFVDCVDECCPRLPRPRAHPKGRR